MHFSYHFNKSGLAGVFDVHPHVKNTLTIILKGHHFSLPKVAKNHYNKDYLLIIS